MSALMLLTAELCPLDHNTLSMVVKNLAVSQWNGCGYMYVLYVLQCSRRNVLQFCMHHDVQHNFYEHFNKECVSVLTTPVQN